MQSENKRELDWEPGSWETTSRSERIGLLRRVASQASARLGLRIRKWREGERIGKSRIPPEKNSANIEENRLRTQKLRGWRRSGIIGIQRRESDKVGSGRRPGDEENNSWIGVNSELHAIKTLKSAGYLYSVKAHNRTGPIEGGNRFRCSRNPKVN